MPVFHLDPVEIGAVEAKPLLHLAEGNGLDGRLSLLDFGCQIGGVTPKGSEKQGDNGYKYLHGAHCCFHLATGISLMEVVRPSLHRTVISVSLGFG